MTSGDALLSSDERDARARRSAGPERFQHLYDVVYSGKDYSSEAAVIHRLIQARCPTARTLLDVACGTGRHLEQLNAHYEVEGVDVDEQLLEIARGRVPDVRFSCADMRDFDLGRRFDAITCLFGAIAYVLMVGSLAGTIAAMARHLEPGGVLIVEPWFTPDAWEAERPMLLTVDRPDLMVARMNVNRRVGHTALVDFHYLVGTEADVEHVTERHEFGLFSDGDFRAALAKARLRVEHDPDGCTERPLYVARAES